MIKSIPTHFYYNKTKAWALIGNKFAFNQYNSFQKAPRGVVMCPNKHMEIEYCEVFPKVGELPVVKVKTQLGWKTLDSLFNPEKEAQELLKQEGNVYILLGCGSGYLMKELLKRNPERVLAITGSDFLYKKNIKLLQNNNILTSQITLLHCKHPSSELFKKLKNFYQSFPNGKAITHIGECQIFPHVFNPLRMYVEYLKHNIPQRQTRKIKKVLFPQQGFFLEPDVEEELKLRGIEVVTEKSFAHTSVSEAQAFHILENHSPDIIFSINNRGSDRNGFMADACSFTGIVWATWFLDSPSFLVSDRECRKEQGRWAFCWDVAGIEPCQRLGFEKVKMLPLATNHRLFKPGKGKDELTGKLVYVGSPSFGDEERYFASLRRKPQAYRIAELFQNKVIAERLLPTLHEIEDALRQEKIDKTCFTQSEIQRLPAFILYTANLIYRVNALRAVADLNPIVFGDGWEGLLPGQITILPYVDYYRDLPALYRSDCVHLSLTHLQMRYYPNQRIFDAGACARPVLSERLPGCRELFGDEVDDLFYRDNDELHEKAAVLLENWALRHELGQKLNNLVQARHTIAHRVETILSSIASS